MTKIEPHQVYSLAVAFLADLAYPLKAEVKHRNNFIDALVSTTARDALADGMSRLDVPAKFRIATERQRGAISRAEARIQKRRLAAYAKLRSLVEKESPAQATVHVMKKAREMGIVASDRINAGEVKASNAQKLLSPALADILPDALAFAEVMELRERDGLSITLPHLLADPRWVLQIFNLRESWIKNLSRPAKQNRGRPKS